MTDIEKRIEELDEQRREALYNREYAKADRLSREAWELVNQK